MGLFSSKLPPEDMEKIYNAKSDDELLDIFEKHLENSKKLIRYLQKGETSDK